MTNFKKEQQSLRNYLMIRIIYESKILHGFRFISIVITAFYYEILGARQISI